jgi:LytS/YehU family sensor histidine kinase
MIEVTVADDGAGIDEQAAFARGHGIENTRERLRALYGDAQSVTLKSVPNGGAMSEVRLPLREAPTRTAEFPIPSALQQQQSTTRRRPATARR